MDLVARATGGGPKTAENLFFPGLLWGAQLSGDGDPSAEALFRLYGISRFRSPFALARCSRVIRREVIH